MDHAGEPLHVGVDSDELSIELSPRAVVIGRRRGERGERGPRPKLQDLLKIGRMKVKAA